MVPRTTRLEYSIVVVALLVLLFCSKPPKPGTASVNQPTEPDLVSVMPSDPMPTETNDQSPAEPDLSLTSSDFQVIEEPPSGTEQGQPVPTEPLFDEPAPAPLPIPKITGNYGSQRATSLSPTGTRLVTLSPRNLEQPKPSETTEGQISVRWVWNGQEFVPQKVRVVQEPNGVTKIWSLDN